jgi:hypothetical protein
MTCKLPARFPRRTREPYHVATDKEIAFPWGWATTSVASCRFGLPSKMQIYMADFWEGARLEGDFGRTRDSFVSGFIFLGPWIEIGTVFVFIDD